jgi:hypothetical protein
MTTTDTSTYVLDSTKFEGCQLSDLSLEDFHSLWSYRPSDADRAAIKALAFQRRPVRMPIRPQSTDRHAVAA